MLININYIEDDGMKDFPYFWMISKNGHNEGHGWATTEKEAFKDAYAFYMSIHKWEN